MSKYIWTFAHMPAKPRKQTRHIKKFPRKDLTECGNLVSGPLSARQKKVRSLPGLQNEIKQNW